jgi:hypothetical protein
MGESVSNGPLPTAAENPNGLHKRYEVSLTSGKPIDPRAVYFVLRLDQFGKDEDHLMCCREAARTWCQRVFRLGDVHHLKQTAVDLWERLNETEAEIGE